VIGSYVSLHRAITLELHFLYFWDAKEIAERRNRFVHAEYTIVRSDDNKTADFLHQRLKDFSKESRFDKLSNIFKYIALVDPTELAELSDRAAIVAMKILDISERFYP
jgi:hypothetical protein